MKKHLAAVLVAAAASTVLITPAGAAVPSTDARETYACPNEPGKSARVWYRVTKGMVTKLAIDNPCSQFMAYNRGNYASGDARDRTLIAPGVHFNWGKKRLAMYGSLGIVGNTPHWRDEAECGGATSVVIVLRYNDVGPLMNPEYPDETC